jgi:predicted dehydrogenase
LNIGIIGSGFGIYGWAKAASNQKFFKLSTLSKYKKIILERKDTKKLYNKINYHNKFKDLISSADTIIIAKRPVDQARIVSRILNIKKKINLILEKPLSNNAINALKLFKKIKNNKINYLFGMTINETKWAVKLKNLIKQKKIKKIEIDWYFLADHYKHNKNNWKRFRKMGGGMLRFYLIHFIYIFSFFKNWDAKYVSKKMNSAEDPSGILKLKNQDVEVVINADSQYKKKSFFNIKIEYKNFKKKNIKLDNPFAESLKNLIPLGIDFRIKNLQKILNKAYNGYWSKLQETENYLSLWKKIDRDL